MRPSTPHRNAYAVQTPRHLVAALVPAELSSGVQHGHDRLQSAFFRARVQIARDAAAVVPHRAAPVFF